MNSLPTVPQQMVEEMQRQAEKKFGKVPGLEEFESQQSPAKTAAILEVPTQPEEQQDNTTVAPEEIAADEAPQVEAAPVIEEKPEKETRNFREEQNRNFRAIKEKAERAERERDEALKLVKEMAAQSQPKYQAPTEESDDFNINPDDLVEGKHLSKVGKQINSLKQQLSQYQQQSQLAATEAKLKAQYADFDQVVSKENLETFNYAYPELMQTINSTPDIYTKAVSAYKMIKQFGIHQPIEFQQEKEASKKNIAKPRPLTSVSPQQGDSPMSRANAFANGLTKELQDQLRKEMNDARKGY